MLTRDFVRELRLARALRDEIYIDRMTRGYCFSDLETLTETEHSNRRSIRAALTPAFETRDGWRVK